MRRAQILNALLEDSSMRSVSGLVGLSIGAVSKLLIEAGEDCAEFHDINVRGLKSEHIQCDENWPLCYAREKNAGKKASLILQATFELGQVSILIAN